MLLGVAACDEFLGLDDGWPPLAAALTGEGVESEVVAWDSPSIEWGRYDLVTVMCAWGYVTDRDAFLGWAEVAADATKLINTPAMLRWSSDKRYLADLAAAGVSVVPTRWVVPGAGWEPPAADYVIKPTVASGGLGAARYHASPRRVADGHVRRLHDEGQTVMVQPYQASIDTLGETALVVIDGSFSHAVSKAPLLAADVGETDRLWEREVITPTVATASQRNLAGDAMGVITARFGSPVYARIDLVGDRDGNPSVVEAELVEPSLFLTPGAARRLAAAFAGRIRSSTGAAR